MRPLVWFRSDLRTRDNTALFRVCKAADKGVVALLTITPRQWKDRFGWGDPKADFVLRNMRDLADALASLNIPVRVIHQPSFSGLDKAIIKLMRECECDALYFNREYEHYETVPMRRSPPPRPMPALGSTSSPIRPSTPRLPPDRGGRPLQCLHALQKIVLGPLE